MDVDATIGLYCLFVVLSQLFSACKLILLVLCHYTTLSKDVRVYRIRNTKGEDKTEVNGNSLLTNAVPLKIPKLKANPLVHQDETRALLTSESGAQNKGKFQKDQHKDPSNGQVIYDSTMEISSPKKTGDHNLPNHNKTCHYINLYH